VPVAALSQGANSSLITLEYFVRDRNYAYGVYIWGAGVH
jgi:hypothetical protein